ncbi:hypothetical protein tloyanaT_24950 [Thalassotalea loyana]|uniref:Glutaredoxin domain-containing protein n=1 Tax=Thalassotalea loyana TaxID=280483 RepID=A0ABQ6HFA4_9GAMM|nr:glutaredoxin family protein [Thalassotalea loyana]GLX86242.1 hypothetical protein tloyanaT_24950 [Thalassotalea loyana]
MNSKPLIYGAFLTVLAIGTAFSIYKFSQKTEVKNGVVEIDNRQAFSTQAEVTAILYGKTTCPYCKQAVAELDRQGIKYIYKNIKDSKEALNEFAALDGNAIPLLITRKLRITGFDPQWYSKAVLVDSDLSEFAPTGTQNL